MNDENADKPVVLFPGLFQGVTDAHVAMVRVAVEHGHRVCVAIRDTKKTEDTPFTYEERVGMFLKHLREELDDGLVWFIKIPDIVAIIYGHNVGWKQTCLRLSDELEAVVYPPAKRKNHFLGEHI